MKSILIVTSKSDPHSDAVIRELNNYKCNILRINSQDFLNCYKYELGFGIDFVKYGFISDNLGRSVNLNKLISAYYRKPIEIKPHSELHHEGASDFSIREGEIALKFLYTYPNLNWINNPFLNRQAQLKFSQLHFATKFGLKIPKTLITNDPNKARIFFELCRKNVLCKSMQGNSIEMNKKLYHTYAHKLSSEEQTEFIENIRFAPTFLQEYIEKSVELRINIVGSKVFATEIDSQSMELSKYDWRKADPFDIPHKPFNLPLELEKKLIRFVKYYGLHFSAIDMIKTPVGEYVFLENNPNGQWYWIEMITNQPIANAIAKLLLKIP